MMLMVLPFAALFLSIWIPQPAHAQSITEIIDSTGDGTNGLVSPWGIAVDGVGNVYVTGETTDNAFKITPDGTITEIIDSTGDGVGNGLDLPRGIAVDGSGNVYVAGTASDNVFGIAPGGAIVQIMDFTGDGEGNLLDFPEAIAVDGSGNVYAAGSSSDNAFKIESSPLPVELVHFDGTVDQGTVMLTWRTDSETNNAGFEVQHSKADDSRWDAIGFVAGHGTTVQSQSYRHRVSELAPGRHLFRLKQIDHDGSFAYTEGIEVTVGVPGTHLLSAAYPNPFNRSARFTLAIETPQHVLIEVNNVLGQRVAVLHDGVLTGGTTRTFTLDGSNWPSGIYVSRLRAETFVESRVVFLQK